MDGVLKSFAPAGLTYYTIPNGVVSIGDEAFSYCEKLVRITLPNSITDIGSNAFSYCNSLRSINIPNVVESIGDNAFACCRNLERIIIPESITEIGYMAFSGCSKLKSITIPNSIIKIGSEAFTECESLTEFKGKYASEDGRCLITDGRLISFAPNGITGYTIPKDVTIIGDNAFGYSSLKSINIPKGVTKIGNNAFHNCHYLTSITLPETVTAIGNDTTKKTIVHIVSASENAHMSNHLGVFSNCSQLTRIICMSTTPPTGSESMFTFNGYKRKIYVPHESVEAYKAAKGWSEYADAIEGYNF